MTRLPKWTAEDSAAACLEHWDIFELDGDPNRPEIQVLDENPGPYSSDDDVIALVERRAAEGSPLHQKALLLERSHDHGLGHNYWEQLQYGSSRP